MQKKGLSVRKSSIFSLLLIIILSVVLSACNVGSAEADITVYKNKYQIKIILAFTEDQINFIGGPQVVEQQLDEMVLESKSDGTDYKWRDITAKDSSIYRYELIAGKTEIANSNTDGFTWRETKYNNRKAYEFKYTDLSDTLIMFQDFTLTLHAGKILSSNGTELNSSTVTWVNPSVTPSAIVIPKGSGTWLLLLLAFMLIVAVGALLIYLIVSGKLKKWASTGLNVGKWKIEETKLNSVIKSMEKEKGVLVTELGRKAWEERVSDPAYAEPFGQLESFDQQASELDAEINDLNATLREIGLKFTDLKSEFTQKIGKLSESQKTANGNLNISRKNQETLEKQILTLQKDKEKTEAEIANYEKKLSEVMASNDEDKEGKSASLDSAIASLNKNLIEITTKLPEIQQEMSTIHAEQAPLTENIKEINNQITQAQADQKATLDPLGLQIAELEEKIKEAEKTQGQLQNQMNSIISTLGPSVNAARPASDSLAPLYKKIDEKAGELAAKSEDHNLLKARLDASDKTALRNLIILIVGLILALVLIIVLLVSAF